MGIVKLINLFIIESPFQLLSAIEASGYFVGGHNTLLVCYANREMANQQIKGMLEFYPDWDDVITYPSPRYNILTGLSYLIEMNKMIRRGYKPDRIFIGEYRSWYMMQYFYTLKPSVCFLLDDGNITIELQNKYLLNNKAYGKRRARDIIRQGLLMFFGYRNSKHITINLFTCFDLIPYNSEQKVIKHDFGFTKTLARHSGISRTTIFFYGAPLSESGLLPITQEMELIDFVRKYYARLNLNLLYIRHRNESEEKIDLIQNSLNLPTIKPKLPAEIEILKVELLPIGIASFFSTVLFSLPKLVSFTYVNSFQIPISVIPEHLQSEISAVYLAYKNSNFIKIVETT